MKQRSRDAEHVRRNDPRFELLLGALSRMEVTQIAARDTPNDDFAEDSGKSTAHNKVLDLRRTLGRLEETYEARSVRNARCGGALPCEA